MSGGHGRRRRGHEEHEEHVNHEAWVIPYADILTLLMALFLVMWAIARDPAPDPVKAAELSAGFQGVGAGAISIQEGGGRLEPGSNSVNPSAASPGLRQVQAERALREQQQRQTAVAKEEITLDQLEKELRQSLAGAGLADAVTISRSDRGLYVSVVTDAALFSSGSADISGSGQDLLSRLITPLLTLTNPVVIEGHTDSRPISSSRFPSNWELSTARATNVLRFMVERGGFPADRVSAAGFADTQPAGDNATEAGRARNRRVDIVVLAVAAYAPLGSESGGSGDSARPGVRYDAADPGLPDPLKN